MSNEAKLHRKHRQGKTNKVASLIHGTQGRIQMKHIKFNLTETSLNQQRRVKHYLSKIKEQIKSERYETQP